MAQELLNTQEQQLTQELQQTHTLKAQQVLMMRMLEMPLARFEESVRAEMDENPALSEGSEDSDFSDDADSYASSDAADAADSADGSDSSDELDRILSEMAQDDQLPTSDYASLSQNGDDTDDMKNIYQSGDFYD